MFVLSLLYHNNLEIIMFVVSGASDHSNSYLLSIYLASIIIPGSEYAFHNPCVI